MHKFSFIVLFAFAAFLNMSCSSTESQLKNSASDYAEVPMPESALSEDILSRKYMQSTRGEALLSMSISG